MNRFFLALAMTACLVAHRISFGAESAGQQTAAAERQKLQMFVGEWAYEGTSYLNPFDGTSGKFSGKDVFRSVLNGFFIEEHWRDVGEGGVVAEGIIIRGYDPKTGKYAESSFDNEGSASHTTTTFDGKKWASLGTRIDPHGKSYRIRFTSEFSADKRTIIGKAEYSDDGKTWKKWWDDILKKTGDTLSPGKP